METDHVHRRTCSLCDALCRVRVEVKEGAVRRVSGEPEDPFSQGHICPKAAALGDLYHDPDRLRAPLRRTARGWEEIGWEEALEEAASRLAGIRAAHGRDAVGVYIGNPNVHHYGSLLGLALLVPMLDTRARFSAMSVDNLPHVFAAWHMFGHQLLIGVPDIDRTSFLLVLGANPWVANGGGMSSGDVRRRVRGVQQRGGRVIVVDPRRTETAEAADAWLGIRPGADALLLLAMLQVLFAEGRVDGGAWRSWCTGLEVVEQLAAGFPPERVEAAVGLSAAEIRGLALELAAAPQAVVYGRIGVCTQRFGGLAAWLVVVINAVTGNLDRPGGLMFTRPAVDTATTLRLLGQAGSYIPGSTRGSALPAVGGELPLAALAEEIETAGPGQVRALISIAGNPALSAPEGPRLDAALDSLEFRLSIDMYLNETSRKADLILPACTPLERDHYPMGLSSITVRNVASWSEGLFEPVGARDDWEILSGLAEALARKERRWLWVAASSAARRIGPRRILDAALRVGPYGPLRGGRVTLATLAAATLTVDLGPLQPAFPGRLGTADRKAHLAPQVLVHDVSRLERDLVDGGLTPPLVLIGRRDLRSNNSWMHNSERLVRGRPRCTLHVHPQDAAAHGISPGDRVELSSRTGSVVVPAEVTEGIRPGVVSLPHGWGHDRAGSRLSVAAAHAGVSANDVTDAAWVDPLTGTAAFNGLPVRIRPVGRA